MKPDQFELLSKVAKVIGLTVLSVQHDKLNVTKDGKKNFHWNPLTDDADAFRLLVERGMTIKVDYAKMKVSIWDGCSKWHSVDIENCTEVRRAVRLGITQSASKVGDDET